jgi:hypothetical protein
MYPSTHRARFLCVLALLVCLCGAVTTAGPSSAAPASRVTGVRLDPSKTWVGLASVHLEVGELRRFGDELLGDYRIRVPLRPSKNDVGTIRLAPVGPMERVQRGGRLIGDAVSEGGKIRSLVCEVRPDGTVTIDVISEERTLSFKTRYHLTGRP